MKWKINQSENKEQIVQIVSKDILHLIDKYQPLLTLGHKSNGRFSNGESK